MFVNVSECSGWNMRVNELGDNEQECDRLYQLRWVDPAGHPSGRDCSYFEGLQKPLRNFQITSTYTHFDVRFSDSMEITSTGY